MATLENYYSKQVQALEDKKKADQAQAGVNYQMLMKYLPAQQKAQGMSNLGISESGKISAMNNYQNNLSTIEQNYNTNKLALEESTYNKYKSLLDSATDMSYQDKLKMLDGSGLSGDNMSALQNYAKANTGYADTMSEASTLVDEAIKSGYTEEKNAALEYLEQNKSAMSTDDYNTLAEKLTKDESGNDRVTKSYSDDIPLSYVKGLGNGSDGNNIKVTVGSDTRNKNTEYSLQVGTSVSDENLVNLLNTRTNNAAQKGQLYAYNGQLYIFTSTGWKTVADRKDKVSTVVEYIKTVGPAESRLAADWYQSQDKIEAELSNSELPNR